MGGFFGVTSRENCVHDLFYGTDYHSHLGTVRGGMAVFSDGYFRRTIHNISNSPFRTCFDSDYASFCRLTDATCGLGSISDTDDQPLIFFSHLGVYSIVTVGLVTNINELVADLIRDNTVHFSAMQAGNITQTEIIATLINSQETITEGIKYARRRICGSCSILLLNDKREIYAARDRYGRTPVVVGTKDGACAASLESCSFPNLGFRILRDLGPGEIVKLTPDGMEVLSPPESQMSFCSFFYIYYGFPASTYEGVNVEASRYANGAALALRDTVKADIVAGIPDSGVGHALGYAHASGILYARPFVKYTPTWPRSFTPTEQSTRQHIAQMKLIPIPELIRNKDLVFCDDSIVRGTQLRDQVKRIREEGARSIHMRIACPPLIYPCRFLNFSRSNSVMDLATRRIIRDFEGENADLEKYRNPDSSQYKNMVDRIKDRFGLDSLVFQRIDDMKRALGVKGLCTYCWTGEDVSMPGSCSAGCAKCPHKCPSRSE